jgi:hypothetical protein
MKVNVEIKCNGSQCGKCEYQEPLPAPDYGQYCKLFKAKMYGKRCEECLHNER